MPWFNRYTHRNRNVEQHRLLGCCYGSGCVFLYLYPPAAFGHDLLPRPRCLLRGTVPRHAMSQHSSDTRDAPLYRRLAVLYEQAIAAGSLTPGMRMPSVRELCQRHQVSLTTALQVLRQLESQGCVEARDRVGYFVCEPGGVVLPGAREPELHEPLTQDPRVFAGINERISGFLDKARRAGPLPLDLGSARPPGSRTK